MSYDISLHDPVMREVLYADMPHDMGGGTYCAAGRVELSVPGGGRDEQA